MGQIQVILAWATTGQICDADGKRVENGNVSGTFTSVEQAREFCGEVLRRRPFLECNLRTTNGMHLETVHSTTGWDLPYRLEANGNYRVMLTEWLSQANLRENGEYRQAEEPVDLFELPTYRSAKRYCKSLEFVHQNVVPWIFGPSGKIMLCGGREVTTDESGQRLLYLPWWKTLWRTIGTIVV